MRLTPLLALLLAALAFGLTACGDDDDDDGGGGDQPQVFEVEANEEGVTAPETLAPGAVEIRFSNTGKRDHSAQIIALDGHTPEEAIRSGEGWGERGEALPDWIAFIGGVGTTRPGGAGTAVVDLEPGEYAVFDIDSDADEAFAAFTVEGDGGGELPETEERVEAVEYSFSAEALAPGSQSVTFENAGEEPHHLVGAPLLPGKTEADVKKFVETEKGAPPIDESKAFNTAIVGGGETAVVDLRLESGDYAFLCFIPDRAGGPPHVAKGMATVVTVE